MPLDILQIIERTGGIGIAGIVIWQWSRFMFNHSKHLTDSIKENTSATNALAKAVSELIFYLKRK